MAAVHPAEGDNDGVASLKRHLVEDGKVLRACARELTAMRDDLLKRDAANARLLASLARGERPHAAPAPRIHCEDDGGREGRADTSGNALTDVPEHLLAQYSAPVHVTLPAQRRLFGSCGTATETDETGRGMSSSPPGPLRHNAPSPTVRAVHLGTASSVSCEGTTHGPSSSRSCDQAESQRPESSAERVSQERYGNSNEAVVERCLRTPSSSPHERWPSPPQSSDFGKFSACQLSPQPHAPIRSPLVTLTHVNAIVVSPLPAVTKHVYRSRPHSPTTLRAVPSSQATSPAVTQTSRRSSSQGSASSSRCRERTPLPKTFLRSRSGNAFASRLHPSKPAPSPHKPMRF